MKTEHSPRTRILIIGNSDTNIVGGATAYLTASGQEANEVNAEFRAPYDGILRDFSAILSGATGAGENMVFTVRVNGVPTALTLTLAVAVLKGGDHINTVAVERGDEISIQAVVSAAGGARTAIASVTLEST